jgi:pimeloyl-ACP methyl ester carboxylesterase
LAEPGQPPRPEPFTVEGPGPRLEGEAVGEGLPIVLLHGVTATRRYVLHGSSALVRQGFELVSYDARAHGESGPAPEGEGYGYPELAADLGRVIEHRGGGRPVLCGHSMGCHTAAAYALDHADELSAAILIGPVTLGLPPTEEVLARWDRLADGLEGGGVDGFMEAYEANLEVDPPWRETVLRLTRERMQLHRHPAALARAIRELPRSIPFDGPAELESLDLPALVVASHDEADPGHPHAVAEAWAERLPRAELVGEEPGSSPLAWQGGRLSRAIGAFLTRARVGPGRRQT